MTHGQIVRRITAVVSQLNNLSVRLDKLTEEAAKSAPTTKGKAKAAPKAKAAKAPKQAKRTVIGASIVYQGLKGKVLERKGSKFLCEMSDGKRRQVSTVYVYRQLSKSVKPKVAKQQEEKALRENIGELQTALDHAVSQPAPAQVTHQELVAQPQDQQKAS
jgi:hypothetical protein